jgi:hypothetical protein
LLLPVKNECQPSIADHEKLMQNELAQFLFYILFIQSFFMKKNTKRSNNPVTKNQEDVERTDPALKKGYNEKNPSQPQGAFSPDSKDQHRSVQEDIRKSTDKDEIEKP